ncbi:MAG: hypothetical protein IPO08_21975 [Xanthomonadales bacterium]|nr:hypothetical protein [Xanthomonadales bacterium]
MSWRARIGITSDSAFGVRHVIIEASGDDPTELLNGVKDTMGRIVGTSEVVLMRREPEVRSDKNFETDQMEHRGYARFTCKP